MTKITIKILSWSWAGVIRVIINSIALFQFQLSDTKSRQAAGTSSKYLTMNLKMLMTIAGYQRDQRGIIKFCKNPDSPVPSHYIRLVMLDCPSPRWEFSAVISWYSHLSLNRITGDWDAGFGMLSIWFIVQWMKQKNNFLIFLTAWCECDRMKCWVNTNPGQLLPGKNYQARIDWLTGGSED